MPHAMPLDFRLRAGPGPLPLSPLEPRGDRTSSSFMRGGETWGRVVVRMSPGQSTLEPAPTLLPVTLPLRLLLLLLLLLPPRRDREVLRPLRGMPEEDDGHWAP